MGYLNPPTIQAKDSYRIELRRVFGSPRFKPAQWLNLIGWEPGEETLRVFRTPEGWLQRWDVASGHWLGAVRVRAVPAHEAARVGDTHLIVTTPAPFRRASTVLWDITAAAAVSTLPTSRRGGRDIFVSDDGRFVLSGDRVTAIVNSLPGGESVTTAPGIPRAISADGSRFLVMNLGAPRGLSLWSADARKVAMLPIADGVEVTAAVFGVDGDVFVGRSDGCVLAWLPESTTRWSVPMHHGAVAALALSPDGATLYSVGPDDRLCATGADGRLRWSVALCRARSWLSRSNPGEWRVVPSPSGALVATGTPGTGLRIFDAVTGVERSTIEGHAREVTCLAVSPDGRLVASGANDGDVRVNDVETGETLWVLEVDRDRVTSVEFLPDRPALRTCGRDCVVRVWSLTSGFEEASRETARTYQGARAYGAPDASRVLVVHGSNAELYRHLAADAVVWPQRFARASDGRRVEAIEGAAFSADGLTVVLALGLVDDSRRQRSESWQLMTLDAETGGAVGEPVAASGKVLALAETDDGPVSMVAVGDDLVLTEEWGSRRTRRESVWASRCRFARLSADRRWLVVGGPAHVDVHDLALPRSRFAGRVDPTPIADQLTTLALSPRGNTIAVGTSRGCVLAFALSASG